MKEARFIAKFRDEGGVYGVAVMALHVVAVVLLAGALPGNPELLSMAILAYTLGLRHAFDPDHIAAIDNSVRKMSQGGARPQGAGFFFSLGHSSVVFLLSVSLSFGGGWVISRMPEWKAWGGIVGPIVSGVFLVLIGFINFAIWLDVGRLFRRLHRGETVDESEFASPKGFLVRAFRPLFGLISRSWHLLPLGFLFGLGFDTATEIGLLALSAQGAAQALPLQGLFALPLLFASGMSLLDTADGLFMTRAYRWATISPLKKVFYNLSVTGLSVLVALVIGSVELLQVALPELGWKGAWVDWLANFDFGNLGMILVFVFLAAWVLSVGIWKILRLERGV